MTAHVCWSVGLGAGAVVVVVVVVVVVFYVVGVFGIHDIHNHGAQPVLHGREHNVRARVVWVLHERNAVHDPDALSI